MNNFFTIIHYIFVFFSLVVAVGAFLWGSHRLYLIEEISIGKESSRFLASCLAALAFYNLDEVPYVGELIGKLFPGF